MSFYEGDVVRLKSGGPKMTVKKCYQPAPNPYYSTPAQVTCIWFDDNGNHKTAVFDGTALVKTE